MTQFVLIAGVMAIAAILVVAWPLKAGLAGDGQGAGHRASGVAAILLTVVLIPVLSIEFYRAWSTWDWNQSTQQSAVDESHEMTELPEMTRRLEQRLAENPDDLEGWMMLGRSYAVMRDFPKAAAAYRKAVELTGGQDPNVLTSYAETLILVDNNSLVGEAGDIFEGILRDRPDHQAALWYGGLRAFAQTDYALAKERWERLAASNPPESLMPHIQERLQDVRSRLGEEPQLAAAPASGDAAAPAPAASAVASSGGIQLSVRVSEGIGDGRDLSGGLLFIIARPPGVTAGAPLAVIRRGAAELPLALTLSNDNAMMAGVELEQMAAMQLTARISFSGQHTASPGDLFGQVDYRAESGKSVEIVIDQVVE